MKKGLNKKGGINKMKINESEIKNNKNKKKIGGITLIALVVTIVVLLILAAVSINGIFGKNGLIKQAEEARRKTLISQKEQEVSLAISSLLMKYLGDTSKITVSEVVEKVQANYAKEEEKNAITGTSEEENDKFPGTIEYEKPASGLNEKIVVTVDENLNITSSISESNESGSGNEGSTYSKVGNIYCNAPDLSGFNKEATYYITYDASGTETIYGRLDKVEAPGDWYDYGLKKWANIVTVTDDEVAYWVWIPRYKYKTNSSTETVDAKFVTVGDKCIQVNEDGSEQELDLTDYLLPESFRFGEKGKEVELAGFWMSKYEVQDSANNTEFARIINADGKDVLTVTDVNGKQLSNITGTYTIYVNGDVKNAKTGITLPVEISTLNLGAKKDIMVAKEETTGKKIIGAIKDKTDEAVIKVDTSGFNPKATYYITYDATGEEQIYGRMDKVSAPANWYNYKEKKWANIVTVTGNDITYWTYIPRYEYKAFGGAEYVDVKFISQGQTTPDKNYQIPESFRFGEEGKEVELAGYWISKYEVQDSTSNAEKLSLSEDGTLTTTASNVAENSYTIYVNGVAKTGQKLPAKLSDLGVDTNNKDICVVNETSKMIVGAMRDSAE